MTGVHWHAGSTYLVQLTPDGRVFVHTKEHGIVGQAAQPLDSMERSFQALGVSPADPNRPCFRLDPIAASSRMLHSLPPQPGMAAPFDIPNIPDASGYASAVHYFSGNFRIPLVLLAGFDLDAKLTWLKKRSITATRPLLPGTWWTGKP